MSNVNEAVRLQKQATSMQDYMTLQHCIDVMQSNNITKKDLKKLSTENSRVNNAFIYEFIEVFIKENQR
jgi:predicted double-glycine peptidase